MAGPDNGYSVPQTITTGANVPMIIVAQAPEPSVTRGVTGLFVPIFLAVFIIVAIYFFFGSWQAMTALERQKAVTRDAVGIEQFVEDLYQHNAAQCRSNADRAELAMPNIQAQIAQVRQAIVDQCRGNRNLTRLSNAGAATADCPAPAPTARTEPPAGVNVAEFKAGICRSYRNAPTLPRGGRTNGQ